MTEDEDVAFPVRFYVKGEKIDELKQRAREADDQNFGAHQVSYTLEQAVVVVLHSNPELLFPCLNGWCWDGNNAEELWDRTNMTWEDAE